MTDGEPQMATNTGPRRPGEELRAGREEQGLSIADIAARTRIPQRHLEAVEAGSYASLPSVTYAVGFARAYARSIGLDEVRIAGRVRDEVGGSFDRPSHTAAYEIEDPRRLPSRGVVLGGIMLVLVLLIGGGLWYGTDLFRRDASTTAPATPGGGDAVPIPATVAPAPPTAAGQVTVTATDEVWVRIYDAADTTLLMKTMVPGERFDVPVDATDPKINVGRPDKLAITVNGAAVPPLGDGRVAIKDVPIGATALLARIGRDGPAPAPTPTASPSASPTPRATPSPRASATPTPRTTPTPRPTAAPLIPPSPADVTTGNTL